jgi:hypothetical protein
MLRRVVPAWPPPVEVVDEPGRRLDVDAVAHRHHTRHALVGDLRGQGPVRTDPVVHTGRRIGGGGPLRVRGAARVEHQHRNPGLDKQRAQRRPVDKRLLGRRIRVLEHEVAVPPVADPGAEGEHRHRDRVVG